MLSLADVQAYVEAHIGEFHAARLKGLQRLRLDTLLKRKNPYLFVAKDIRVDELDEL
ncbi:MAG TPA: PmeII family type II restriction endonuclease [Aggregatilineales bacterium]|nr:hypothetical protein [Anaerolineales bacterium]HRE48507.1 PmeII family type II restriction endonuclease [Aggregatilineales bacterium]